MNEKIKNHLVKYAQSKGYGTDDATLIEILTDSRAIGKQDEDEHRWWVEYTQFVEVDGMIIGFANARSTGDMSARESGWEFDPSSIFEAEKYIEPVTKFRAVK